MIQFRVERTSASVGFELRQRVLRPHQRVEDMVLPGDRHPDTGHFCAIDRTGRVVGTGNVRREAPPWKPDATAWRLRGMATEPALRGRGIGKAVLAALLDHIAIRGGGLGWCSARLAAVNFYRRAGFVTRGEPFEEPFIGLHVFMLKEVVESSGDTAAVTEGMH